MRFSGGFGTRQDGGRYFDRMVERSLEVFADSLSQFLLALKASTLGERGNSRSDENERERGNENWLWHVKRHEEAFESGVLGRNACRRRITNVDGFIETDSWLHLVRQY